MFIKKDIGYKSPCVKICTSPEHNPPSMISLQPGTYTWKCPGCGQETTFTVRGYTC